MVGIAESLRVDAEHRGQGGGDRVRLDSGGDEQARRYGVEGSSQLGFQDQPTQARRVSRNGGGIRPNDPVYVARGLLSVGVGRSGVGDFNFSLGVNFG